MIHCMWNTEDGNMDFQRNLHLREKTGIDHVLKQRRTERTLSKGKVNETLFSDQTNCSEKLVHN